MHVSLLSVFVKKYEELCNNVLQFKIHLEGVKK